MEGSGTGQMVPPRFSPQPGRLPDSSPAPSCYFPVPHGCIFESVIQTSMRAGVGPMAAPVSLSMALFMASILLFVTVNMFRKAETQTS